MRSITVSNLYDKKYDTLGVTGPWAELIGDPETSGIWLIFGNDKNGKTRTAITVAYFLSTLSKVGKLLYISAEEGFKKTFTDTLRWANISYDCKGIHFTEYQAIDEIYLRLSRRKAPRIVLIDNLTMYKDEIRSSTLQKLIRDHRNTLFIFMAHEDRRHEPFGAPAQLAKKLADIIIHVQGLKAFVSGRCPGGEMDIDQSLAWLYHGDNTDSSVGAIPSPSGEAGRGKKEAAI